MEHVHPFIHHRYTIVLWMSLTHWVKLQPKFYAQILFKCVRSLFLLHRANNLGNRTIRTTELFIFGVSTMIVFEWEREREESKEGNVNTFVRSCCEDLLQLLWDRTMKPILGWEIQTEDGGWAFESFVSFLKKILIPPSFKGRRLVQFLGKLAYKNN